MVIKLIKKYFLESDERYTALLLLLGGLVCIFSAGGMLSALTTASFGITNALTEMNSVLFLESLQTFTLLCLAFVGLYSVKEYFLGSLSLKWRRWLTKEYVDEYINLEKRNYLELARLKIAKADNPAQRIQDDIDTFVYQSIWLSAGLLQNIITQATFLGTLWYIGGPLDVVLFGMSLTIPGYLVWSALSFSMVVNLSTHYIGHKLSTLTNKLQGLEADFRKDLGVLEVEAENIALDGGEKYYNKKISEQNNTIYKTSSVILQVRIKLNAFISYFQQVTSIFPYLMAAPLYFAKKITQGSLFQISYAFSEVQQSLTWFSNSYESLATYYASASRIVELDNAMKELSARPKSQGIQIVTENTDKITLRNVSITDPSSTTTLVKGLNMTLNLGESTVIQGRSGSGKSTAFKVVGGTWTYGSGTVVLPNNKKRCFLPQIPSLPNDSLKAVLAYPDDVNDYQNSDYEKVMVKVGLNKLVGELSQTDNWSNRLSPGEQERIAFARVLLKEPDIIFLDEATASLDTENEAKMYKLLKRTLPAATIFSIAHRPTAASFHEKVIRMEKSDKSESGCRSDKDSCESPSIGQSQER